MILSTDQRERLVALDRAQGARGLLRGLSHEIRNHLQVVALASQLGDGGRTPDINTRVEHALEEINRHLELLSTLGRNPSDGPPTVPANELWAMLRLATSLQRGVPTAPIRFDGSPADDRLAVPLVVGLQVLLNLVSNAREAAPNGIVRVAYTAEEGCGSFAVEDGGPGPPLDPGAPLESTKPVATHAGTGLFAAMTLTRQHGGTVRVMVRPDGGCRAIARLPFARA
jgi:signal transduction histidine kinase